MQGRKQSINSKGGGVGKSVHLEALHSFARKAGRRAPGLKWRERGDELD